MDRIRLAVRGESVAPEDQDAFLAWRKSVSNAHPSLTPLKGKEQCLTLSGSSSFPGSAQPSVIHRPRTSVFHCYYKRNFLLQTHPVGIFWGRAWECVVYRVHQVVLMPATDGEHCSQVFYLATLGPQGTFATK